MDKPLQNIFEGKVVNESGRNEVLIPGREKPWENNDWQKFLKPKSIDEMGFSPKELDEEQKYLVSKLGTFIERAEREIAGSFEKLVISYESIFGKMPKDILEYLKNKDLMFPKFSLLVGDKAQNFLSLVGHEVNSGEAKVFKVFNLPKPLAKFWWKGDTGGSMAGVNREVEGAGIEWGYFYHNIMPSVWENIGFLECESDIRLEQINGIGEHNPDSFYYIWEVGKANLK